MVFFWMPYVCLRDRAAGHVITIDKASFWPDQEQTWQDVLKCDRPPWLDIFRDFPSHPANAEGKPLAGTIVFSDDEEWLEANMPNLVALVYFLSNPRDSDCPAELFKYLRGSDSDDVHRAAPLWSKKVGSIESSDSIVLYPPYELRGHNNRQVTLRSDSQEHQNLIQLFQRNPNHRIWIACRNFFRAQFGDWFAFPTPHDIACYCAALEAAFEIEPKSREIGKQLAEYIQKFYWTDNDLKEWVLGLYTCRSIHVHGFDVDSTNQAASFLAYRGFMAKKGNISVLHSVCKEVILAKIRAEHGLPQGSPSEWSIDLLGSFFHSTKRLQRLKQRLGERGSADSLSSLSGDDLTEFAKDVRELAQTFRWICVSDLPDPALVLKCICYVASAIGKLTSSSGEVYQASDALGQAADKQRIDDIITWTIDHREEWGRAYRTQALRGKLHMGVLQTCLFVLAAYFDVHRRGKLAIEDWN
jgi:hypothetical protein